VRFKGLLPALGLEPLGLSFAREIYRHVPFELLQR
jgi:hypothetical protein